MTHRKVRKLLALVLALCLSMSFVLPASAAGRNSFGSQNQTDQNTFGSHGENGKNNAAPAEIKLTDAETGVAVDFGAAAVADVTVEPVDTVDGLEGKTYVAYDITPYSDTDRTEKYTGSAEVTIPLTDELQASDELTGFVVETDGSVTYVDGERDGENYTFTTPHFSKMGVADTAESAGGADDTASDDATVPTDDAAPADDSVAAPLADDGIAGYALTMGTKPADGTTTGNPFVKGTGGSNSFRIPAMVTLNDGTIVAAADARWNTTYDGGGLDTIVSYSTDNGANWNYTFANYLGDNGNTYNGSGSTAFIDPALATDGETVYMLCDLYPYGIALNGSGNTAPSTAVGFNSDGTLKLAASGSSTYNYYLKDGQIYDSSNNVVSGYTVDAYFNITGNGYDTNLFFSDSPYKVVRTGYLYLTKSADGGKTWSAPTLIPNVKTSGEQVCLVGPGRGLVINVGTTDETIIFPVYSFHGDNDASSNTQRLSFIYSTDSGATWDRTSELNYNWASEAAVVELADGTLRFFFRNGTSYLEYVDYNMTSKSWGSVVNTYISTNSNTQISAISLQNTVDGKQVILVSCPTGSNNNGSADSSGSARLNGRIQIGLVDSETYKMTWETPIDVTTNNSQFMYSCLTALTDSEGNETGKVAILYENQESAWGTGDNCYYTMDFATYTLSLTFDPLENEDIYIYEEDVTGIKINFGTTEYPEDAITITQKTGISALNGKDYVAYDITVTDFSGTATVTIPLNNAFADDAKLYAVYIDGSGEIAETIQGTYDPNADTFTFTASHFSTYAVVPYDAETPTYTEKTITLTVGESQTVTDATGNYDSYTGGNDTIVKISVKSVPSTDDASYTKADSIESGEKYLIGYGANLVTPTVIIGSSLGSGYGGWNVSGLQMVSTTLSADGSTVTATGVDGYLWQITEENGSYYVQPASNLSQYMSITSGASGNQPVTLSDSATSVTITSSSGTFTLMNTSGDHGLNNFGDEEKFAAGWNTSTNWNLYKYTPGSDGTTEVTFTGVSAGNTTATVGETLYNITVNRKTETVNLSVNGTATYTDATTSAPVVADSTVATASLSGGKLTITGLKDGTTTITTDTTVYTVTVAARGGAQEAFTIAVSEDRTISVALNDGEYVEWSVADASIAGVAGILNTEDNTYGADGMVVGRAVGKTTVTGTVKNASGEIVAIYTWEVTVTAKTTSGSGTRTVYVNVDLIEHCTVYYSINGGELLKLNGTGVIVNSVKYTGTDLFNIMLFAAPDDGYALTYIGYLNQAGKNPGDSGQFYTLSDGNPDGTGSGAWPFIDPEQSTIPTSSNDSTVWKTVNGSLHGFRWALIQGNMSINQMKVLFSNALALGCDGVTTITVNNTDNGAYNYSNFYFVAQRLPTISKEISTINGEAYTDGVAVELGDTISYTIKVTKYKVYGNVIKSYPEPANNSATVQESAGTITFMDDSLTDELTDSSFSPTYTALGTTESSDVTYTYTTTLKLTTANFADVVKDGTITNTADLSYDYSAGYSTGSLSSSASAEAKKVTVKLHTYVIDFGLPVDIDLSDVLGDDRIESGTATFGTISANGTKFTYTPNKVLTDTDYVTLTLSGDHRYGVYIVPASNVLYEDKFLVVNPDKGQDYELWSESPKTISTAQSAEQTTLYGHDTAYDTNSTGKNSMGSAWTIKDLAPGSGSKYLTTTFYGNGFDLIGTSGPDTGYVYLLIQGTNSTKLVVIDTSYVDGEGTTLYQVPLAHEELTEGTYTVNIRAAYRAGTATEGSGTSLASTYSLTGSSSALDDVYAMVDELFMDGFEIDDVELVYFDESSPLAELNSATYAMTYADGTNDTETATVAARPNGTTVTIDGFRVYRSSDNSAYLPSEQKVTYVNVLDATLDGENFKAYVEDKDEGTWTLTNYEANGGPQNEVYLGNGTDAIAFKVSANATVQISARAVGTDSANLFVNNVLIATISSNTEMYYEVKSDTNGIITIKNTGTGMLALGNLKLQSDGTEPAMLLMSLTEDEIVNVVPALLRMASSPVEPEPEPEPEPVFTPEQLDVRVRSTNLLRSKLITVTISASTDVARLTVNGEELKPTNGRLVERGWSNTYTYVIMDVAAKTDSKSYEIIVYDADGVASEPVTVQG